MAAIRNLSVADIRRELARREAGATRLVRQRTKLAKRLATLDAELADLGVDSPRGLRGRRGPRGGARKAARRRRSRGGLTLVAALEKGVTVGKVVSPMEASAAAKRAGYRTASKTFGIQVATALAKATSFKRVGRGRYERLGTSTKG